MQNSIPRVSPLEQTMVSPNLYIASLSPTLYISNKYQSEIVPQKGTVGETTTSISNDSRGESKDNVEKRKRKASISKEDKNAKKMKYDLPTCPIVSPGNKTSFSNHLDVNNVVYNNFTNLNKNPYDNHEEKSQPLNKKENSKELQLPSQSNTETVTKTETI